MTKQLPPDPTKSLTLQPPTPVVRLPPNSPEMSHHYHHPRDVLQLLAWLRDYARSMCVNLCAGKGHGKSKFIGRSLAWQDFVRGIPLVLWDPVGGSIDQFLTKIAEQSKENQLHLWPRVIYVNVAGYQDHVVPLPIIHRISDDESLYAVASRYVDAIRRTDVHLASASIEGLNALIRVAVPTIVILAALGYPITQAISLLDEPEAWSDRFQVAVNLYPEAIPAVKFFQEYMSWDKQTRTRRTESLRVKLTALVYDPTIRAIYGALPSYRFDWEQVVRERQAVLLDFRNVYDLEQKRFSMLWSFSGLLNWVKHRGPGHHHRPVSIIIDELSAMINADPTAADLMAADIDSLLNVIARNYNLWICAAYQTPSQFNEKIQKALFSCGTQIIGSVSSVDDALILARNLFTLDLSSPKRFEPMYGSVMGMPTVLDYRQIDYTVEENLLLQAYRIKNQRPFHFLARIARREGDSTAPIRPISIANFDPGRYADEALATKARAILSRRSGVPVQTILHEIEFPAPHARAAGTINKYALDFIPKNITRHNDCDDDEEALREEKQ